MAESVDHAAFVKGLVEESGGDLPRLFAASLDELWKQTSVTLGEVTLSAIMDRVLTNAVDKFPFLAGLKVEPARGVRIDGLRGKVNEPDLLEGVQFVLIEFLTVIGNLTAEILTPDLHAGLARAARSKT